MMFLTISQFSKIEHWCEPDSLFINAGVTKQTCSHHGYCVTKLWKLSTALRI